MSGTQSPTQSLIGVSQQYQSQKSSHNSPSLNLNRGGSRAKAQHSRTPGPIKGNFVVDSITGLVVVKQSTTKALAMSPTTTAD